MIDLDRLDELYRLSELHPPQTKVLPFFKAILDCWPDISAEMKRLRALETVWPRALDQAYEQAAQICEATPYMSFATDRIRALKEKP